MAVDNSQSQESDLDRTDRLPILEGAVFDDDVEDDAVRMDYTAALPTIKNDFPRSSGVDLPSLAESVRSVEERIARQHAEYEELKRAYQKALEAEADGAARSEALAAELLALRTTLDAEQTRSRETDKALAEQIAAAERTRSRIETALREAERYQSESNTLKETLAARDASIAQVLHSLGERDAQLSTLQSEHARLVPELENRSQAALQLTSELTAARAHAQSLAAELQSTRKSVAALTDELQAGGKDLSATQSELSALRAQAASYLEQLRTREWRRGFDHNLFRELDAEIGAAQESRESLQVQRDQLQARVTEVESRLSARDASIAKLKAAAVADEAQRVKHQNDIQKIDAERAALVDKVAAMELEHRQLTERLTQQDETIQQLKAAATADEAMRIRHEQTLRDLDGARASLMGQITELESDRSRLKSELANKDREIDAALVKASSDAERFKESLAAAEQARLALSERVDRLQSEARARDDEMGVLMAHLQEARRPIVTIEAEVKRLTEELAAKTQALEALSEQNRELRLSVERTRGALEEREFLIRRLERSESNNANVLGRIQTSIERLGAPAGQPVNAAQPVECTAELVRVDGQHNTSFTLARRTRIGRAPGCELRIESSSVSRHHALVLLGQREAIIEDLNSTNGVLVNGRKVARQVLHDGDMLMIGEANFRFSMNLLPRVLEAPVAEQ